MSLTKKILWGGVSAAAAGLAARSWLRRRRRFDFRGRTVALTGGSRGLGLVLARELLDRGARVGICGREEQDLRIAEEELGSRGGEILAFRADVREREEVEAFVRRVERRLGDVEVLIHVAGVIQVGPLDAMTEEDFRAAMDTHFWGALYAVRAVLPGMRKRGRGRIVTVASLGGKRAVPHMLPYAASKFALVGLSQGLRAELQEEGILVTTACPGLMRTGSPVNATFKGQHRKEHAWFRIGDSLPLVSIPAPRAADQILEACRRGQAETLVTGPGNLASLLHRLAPGLTTELLGIGARLFPEMGGIGTRAAAGHQSESGWAPSWLTRAGDRAAARYNQLPRIRRETAGAAAD